MTTLIATRLLLVAILAQTPANSTADKGVVTGRLLAIDGSPAVSVRVMAMVAAAPALVEPSGDAVAFVSLTETDSAGRYHLENIPPGRYYITAGLADLPTYYPGSIAAATATVISIAAGSITNGIDFTMQRGTGVKVTGRLAILPTLKPSTPHRVWLYGAAPPMIETTLNADGTFEFPKVRPGTYSLRTSIGLSASAPVVVDDRDVTLVVGGDVKGVRVIGKAVAPSAPGASLPSHTIALSPPIGGATSGESFSTTANTDGTFEFLRVPPGIYTIRGLPSGSASSSTLVIADKDVTGVEVSVPFVTEVAGRIRVEDGIAPQQWIVQVQSSSSSMRAFVDSVFSLRLIEGSNQISIRDLPLGYAVKSITSGDLDLTKTSLDVRPGKPIEEIRILVGKTSIEAIAGVKVSGRVFGGTNLSGARVTLASSDQGGAAIEAALNADGTFEFPKVPAGLYNARITGIPILSISPNTSQIFVREPVTGLQFLVSPMTQVNGRLTVVNANGGTVAVPGGIQIQFRRSNSGQILSSQPGGVFGIALVDGEYTISVSRLPAGYTLKSISSGSTDLTQATLKVIAGQPLADIQIVLESR